ncbi:MAG: sigma-70 family RNA polymerase sigma factor [Pirellulales bacterium]|nr:sigma-70 family RNA polymerase sigma factor [Pirellulales bacterium]
MSFNHDGSPPARSGTSGSASSSLLERVKRREPAAWVRLLDLYGPLVYSWCRRSGLRREDAADVLQEVFRTVAEAIGQFHRDRAGDTLRGWLRIITRNKIRDFVRVEGRQPQAGGGSDAYQRLVEIAEGDPDSESDANGLTETFRKALEAVRSEFETPTWQAFWLATVEQRPAAEIGQSLAMSPGAVRQAKYRVLLRLRRELGDVD